MKTLAIAGVTVREALRRKLQVNLLIFGSSLVLASAAMSSLTLGESHRILSDLGLSSMELIGTLIAAFLGASLVAGDLERRVLYPVVAKPIARAEYVVGRYLGLAVVLLLNLTVMAALLGAVLCAGAGSLAPLDRVLAAAIGTIAVQLLVVGAIAVFFSCLTNSTLAAIFTLSVGLAGHLSSELRSLWKSGGAWLARALWYLLPNLSALSLNEAVIYHQPPPATTWIASGCGLLYAATAVALAALVFERRDFR